MSTKREIKLAALKARAAGHPDTVVPAGLTITAGDKMVLIAAGLKEGTKQWQTAVTAILLKRVEQVMSEKEYEISLNEARPERKDENGKVVAKAIPASRFINEKGSGIPGFLGNGWTKSAALRHLEEENLAKFRELVESMPDDEGTASGVETK